MNADEMTADEAVLRTFLVNWRKLPVLVRAGVAGAVALQMGRQADIDVREATIADQMNMKRRGNVAIKFSTAYRLLALLLAALANSADTEAVAQGIDIDTEVR